MFCTRCGKYNPDTKEKCIYCGGELSEKQTTTSRQTPSKSTDADKTLIGVLLALFTGLIGLVIGLLVFPSGYERSSFLSGWVKCYITCIIIAVVIVLAYSCIVFGLIM